MRHLNENQTFQYNGSPITFQKGDSVMVNATEMAKPFGKRCNDFLSTKQTNELINSLSAKTGIPATGLVTVNQGGNNQGTWLHEDLALIFAQWLSPDFYLWCNDRIKELLQYGMTATQPTLEQMINNPDLVISLATQLKNEREEKQRLELKNKHLEKKTAEQEPYVLFAKTAFTTDDKVDIGMAAKILKLGFGRNTLFQKLRQVGVFFSNRNEPKQRFVNAGYFEMKEKFIERNSHPGFVVTKILVTQKGLAYINHLFGGNPSDGKIAAIE
ncbi:KilA-N domain-containing protein [uncultured Parabacteroides sp.]|uniref:KilA-N domain-containing protein n=1 Tax=uncultured Parabacteroides sp. TaxID=512312 RepID=UPI00262074CD|nr:KilA-N domain-containing protein [uncultured Parabacteroides sp.]